MARFDNISVQCDDVDTQEPRCDFYLGFADRRYGPSNIPIFSNWRLGQSGTVEITDNDDSKKAQVLFEAIDPSKSFLATVERSDVDGVSLTLKTFETADRRARIFCKKEFDPSTGKTKHYASISFSATGNLLAVKTGRIITPIFGVNFDSAEMAGGTASETIPDPSER